MFWNRKTQKLAQEAKDLAQTTHKMMVRHLLDGLTVRTGSDPVGFGEDIFVYAHWTSMAGSSGAGVWIVLKWEDFSSRPPTHQMWVTDGIRSSQFINNRAYLLGASRDSVIRISEARPLIGEEQIA